MSYLLSCIESSLNYRSGSPAVAPGMRPIHYINENYDEGDVIFQAKCEVLPTDTPDEVAAKVHALEYAHYPHVIEDLLK